MSRHETSPDDIRAHLEALSIQPGDRVCVHSRMLSFGRLAEGVESVVGALKDAVGPKGTIAFPTFTFHLGPDDIFDPRSTAPAGMGTLSDHLWNLDGVVRSGCPLHSYGAIGADAGLMTNCDPAVSTGPGSSFDILQKAEFKLVLLGCNFHEGATHVHHTEAQVGVPYREWLELRRNAVSADGTTHQLYVRYYARRHDCGLTTNLQRIMALFQESWPDAFVQVPGGSRQSFVVPLNRFDDKLRHFIRDDATVLMVQDSD